MQKSKNEVPRRAAVAIRAGRCEGSTLSFLLCAVCAFVLLHQVEVIIVVVVIPKHLLLDLLSIATKRLVEGEQRLLKLCGGSTLFFFGFGGFDPSPLRFMRATFYASM